MADPKKFKPMLAANDACDFSVLEHVTYPVIVQPKLDGVRCITLPMPTGLDEQTQSDLDRQGYRSQPFSRTLKSIPNNMIRHELRELPWGLDGELMVFEPSGSGRFLPFKDVQSAVMSQQGDPDFVFMIFDCFNSPEIPYLVRYETLANLPIPDQAELPIQLVPSFIAQTEADVRQAYAELLAAGYEGACLRDPKGPYKYGRSTLNQAWLLKLKPKETAEAEVLEVLPLERNTNPAKLDELGHTKHSSHKAGMVAQELMGALRVRGLNGPFTGKEFKIGSGFDGDTRWAIWARRVEWIGKAVTFEYSPDPSYDLPRHPTFKGIRSDLDFDGAA